MRDAVLYVEAADAPFTAEPLLMTPVDFSTGMGKLWLLTNG